MNSNLTKPFNFTLEDFQQAKQRISPYVKNSPLIKSSWLSSLFDAQVYLKLECLQPGRSFKIRGAMNTLLSQNTLPSQVLTASGGNHGLGVSHAAKSLGIPCKVVLPQSTSPYRISLLEGLGADVELYGDSWDDSNRYAIDLAKQNQSLYIHAFADKTVIEGQGTIAVELVDELGSFDVLFASVGGGGLLSGISAGLRCYAATKQTKIYSVETKGADSLAQSISANHVVELPAVTSIAKTLGARQTTKAIFEFLAKTIEKALVVSDKEAVKAIYEFLDEEKLLVEPATSCIIAAAKSMADRLQGKTIVFIICGSNVTLAETEQWKNDFLVE